MQSVINRISPLIAFVVLAILSVMANQRLLTEPRGTMKQDVAASPYDSKLFLALGFGHLATQVDSIWIRALSDDDSQVNSSEGYSNFYYLLDLLTHLDPYFQEAYEAGGNLLIIARKEKHGAEKLLLKGLKTRENLPSTYRAHWERGWALSVLLAYNRLFEFKDLPGAASHFKDAARFPKAPDYLRRLKERLEEPGGLYEVGLRLIDFMLMQVQPDDQKMELEKKKVDLRVSYYLHQANLAYSSFVKLQGTPRQSERTWKSYLKNAPQTDPWGGLLSLSSEGQVQTTTPHEKVFGLY